MICKFLQYFFAILISVNMGADVVLAMPVYGPSDNRKDLFEVTNIRHLSWADSVVGLYKTEQILNLKDQSKVAIYGKEYGSTKNLCPGTRFEKQKITSFCSGTLVTPNHILTAAHCVNRERSCENVAFIFGDSKKLEREVNERFTTPRSEVYYCRQIAKAKFPDGMGGPNSGQDLTDYAFVELDRPVMNHSPVSVTDTKVFFRGIDLVTIGHP